MRRVVALLVVALVVLGLAGWLWFGGNGAKFGKTRSQLGGPRGSSGSSGGSGALILDISGVHLADPYNNVPFGLPGYVPANDSIARWWDSLPAVEAGEIQGYINSLWRIADGEGNYTKVFDSQYWQAPSKPLPNETVKVASWRLWCGARLDMIAYLDPNSNNVNVVIYGTIENMTEYRYCMGLGLATELGFDPGTAWGLQHGYTTHFDYYEPNNPMNISMATYLWRISLPGMGEVVYDWEKVAYHLNFTVKDDGSVWGEVYRGGKLVMEMEYPNLDWFKNETGLDHPQNITITTYNKTHGINVYILLEEPVIGLPDEMKGVRFTEAFHSVETLFWNIIGYPAFSLAANLRWHGVNITQGYTTIARWAAELARQVVLYQVYHPGNKGPFHMTSTTPSSLRASTWGVCKDQSSATALFVANALGLPSVYYVMHYYCPDCWAQAHAISYVLIPTKAYDYNSYWEKLRTDYDGDGKPDHLVLIVDTANAGAEARMSEMYYYVIIPYGFSMVDAEHSAFRPLIYYNPIAYSYIHSLPTPLRAPWQNYTLNVINATRIYYWGYEDNPNGVAVTGVDYLLNRTNAYLWTKDTWYDFGTDNWWSIGIYNKTPEEILENIDRAAQKGAQAMAEALNQPYNKTIIMYVDGMNFGDPLHEHDYDSIHVHLNVAAQVYALALQHYHWTINPPSPPTQPQPIPGNIQQALANLPQQLNQWSQ